MPRIALCLAVLFLAFLVPACGGGGAESAPTASEPFDIRPPASPPVGESPPTTTPPPNPPRNPVFDAGCVRARAERALRSVPQRSRRLGIDGLHHGRRPDHPGGALRRAPRHLERRGDRQHRVRAHDALRRGSRRLRRARRRRRSPDRLRVLRKRPDRAPKQPRLHPGQRRRVGAGADAQQPGRVRPVAGHRAADREPGEPGSGEHGCRRLVRTPRAERRLSSERRRGPGLRAHGTDRWTALRRHVQPHLLGPLVRHDQVPGNGAGVSGRLHGRHAHSPDRGSDLRHRDDRRGRLQPRCPECRGRLPGLVSRTGHRHGHDRLRRLLESGARDRRVRRGVGRGHRRRTSGASPSDASASPRPAPPWVGTRLGTTSDSSLPRLPAGSICSASTGSTPPPSTPTASPSFAARATAFRSRRPCPAVRAATSRVSASPPTAGPSSSRGSGISTPVPPPCPDSSSC